MAVQVVLPLDVETIIPEDESVRTLMRIAERIDYTKLSGVYERENGKTRGKPHRGRCSCWWSWDTWKESIPRAK